MLFYIYLYFVFIFIFNIFGEGVAEGKKMNFSECNVEKLILYLTKIKQVIYIIINY